MNMYTMTLVQSTPEGKGYIVAPKYMPKKWEAKNSQFNTQLNSNSQSNTGATQNSTTTASITEEQKKILLDKLHAGQGELSIEEWDDFLLELTDMGLITNSQRLESMGCLIPLPDNVGSGAHWVTYEQKADPYDIYLLENWEGKPLDFIQKMDFYLYKQMLGAQLNHLGTTSMENTRKTYQKVSDIVKEVLA